LKRIAIIPARGGSKRIPKKNIRFFLGKPIIAYSIETAISSGLFDEVMVSTDDIEIAEIAKIYGAKIPFIRSVQSASDFATTFDVIEEVVRGYELEDKKFDFICCIYPCAPFVSVDKLLIAFDLLQEQNFDSVLPIMPFSFPIQRALKMEENRLCFFQQKYSAIRSQDLERSYHDAGQFYWMKTSVCIEKKQMLTDNSGSVILTELEGQDIDNEVDWKLAELKYELLQSFK